MRTRRDMLLLSIGSMAVALPVFGAQKVENYSNTKIVDAFGRYERIREALSGDSLTGVKEEATRLRPLAKEIGGNDADAAAAKLAAATTITEARTHFGDLSEALVPTLLAADIPGVHGFTCAMVKRSWAQRGETAQNPYYGTSMTTCGVPLKVIAATPKSK